MGDPTSDLAYYDGLIFKTATMLLPVAEDLRLGLDLDDLQQLLRIKVWKALAAFRPERARGLSRENYVFMCLRDQAKDIAKRKRRAERYLDDIAPAAAPDLNSRFAGRHLSVSAEATFFEVEDEFRMPNTLNRLEREIVVRLYRDYSQKEIIVELGLGIREMESAVRSIREKLADWRPAASSSPSSDEPRSRLQSQLHH